MRAPVTSPSLPLFSSADAAALAQVTWLCFDVDDTLTVEGLLPVEAHQALVDAHHAGFKLMAVTGRSLSWAEMLLRVFPLDMAVGETGAACFIKREGGRVEVVHAEPDEAVRQENTRKRKRAEADVRQQVAAARLATDNIGRVYDSAFDLVEDGPLVEEKDASRIRDILRGHGLTVAQSSVHINAWFGDFDKAAMVDRVLRQEEGAPLDDMAHRVVYVGDSKNDGSMFCRTPWAVGVANIAPHLEALSADGKAPKFVVEGQGGHGFAEVVRTLVQARG